MDYRLSVDGGDLRHGLKLLRQTRKQQLSKGNAIIGFDGRYVTLEAGEVMALAHATGAWPGNAYTGASLIAAMAKVPPVGDPIILTCDGVHVTFGSVKVGCRWQPVSSALLHVPASRDWMQALAISYTRSRGQIHADGLSDEVDEAHRQLGKLVQRVAKLLAPLGITAAEVQMLVERRLAERYAK